MDTPPEPPPPRPHALTLVAIGIAGGALSGLFGVGGGIVLVPLLMVLGRFDQRQASATSLLAILPTAIAGSITYLVHGEVDLVAALIIAVGAIGGSLLGTFLLEHTPLRVLRWLFIAMLIVVAIGMMITVPQRSEQLALSLPVGLAYLGIGVVMGVASGLFGIGGAVLAVPALVAIVGVSDLIAKGTSLVVLIPTSIAGSIANTRNRLVNVRAALIVGLAASAASVLGALLALGLPPGVSNILFGVLLLAVAAQLAMRAVEK